MDKKPFPKKTKLINTKEDYGMEYDVDFEMWDDPSRLVLADLIRIVFTDTEDFQDRPIAEQKKDAALYFEAVSQIIIDCSIEGADFSTPETTEATYELRDVSWGFWYEVVISYLASLMNESEKLGKALALRLTATDSGKSNGSADEK